MIFDEVKIYVCSGTGGDGAVTFRREKYVPRGGPSGGDGGNGGNVTFKVNPKLSTLGHFHHGVHFKAQNGNKGGSANKTGASGNHIEVQVPPGTVVKDADTGVIIADLVEAHSTYTIVYGGKGGRGNARFASASNQTPRYAEKGEPGVERWVTLELRLIADVGIVGVPNAGKSTLLSVLSNAKPKIADYPFTTLQPNLGVAELYNRTIVLADIPGLIEGAHMGVGLGHSFLRHIQRTRVLIHLIDGNSENPLADHSQINTELALYDERLAEKPQIVVFNKIDLPDAQVRWEELQSAFEAKGIEIMTISAATHKHTDTLLKRLFEVVDSLPQDRFTQVLETPVYEFDDSIPFEISRDENGTYRVTGKRIERAVTMTYWDNEEAILRFQKILETLGVSDALEKAGVKVGDIVYIGDFEMEWSD